MSIKQISWVVLIALGLAAIVWGYSSAPPQDRAGNPPGNMTCASGGCHNSFALNSGDGSLSIDNVPAAYEPGETYTVTITLSDPGQRRWGFEVTALDENNRQAGTFAVTDPTKTQLLDDMGTDPDFVVHTQTGTFAGTGDGPVSWSFNWTAPDQETGTVTFYATGNAANNNGGTSGDYIYSATTATAVAAGCDRGDADGNGAVNVLDILSVANHILGLMPITGEGLCRADCNADENINVLDALGIANVILGISECAP